MTTPPPAATFSADWLRRREPFDAAARGRSAGALGLASWLAALRPPAPQPWRVIDLACGTGANLRWLAPGLGGSQHWLVVDHDPELLARWPATLDAVAGPALTVDTRALDLARELEALPFAGATLVTASALIDLVSAQWLARLVAACRSADVAVLLALNVDGRHDWDPVDADDARLASLFEAHQGRDKGFGAALGARAAAVAADAFAAAGFEVRSARSDWWLDARADADAAALVASLIDGMAGAAIEQDPAATAAVRAWQARRRALAGRTRLRVGHLDLIAAPPRRE